MTKKILLPLPASVSATYVVAAPEKPVSAAFVTQLGEALPDGVELRVEEIDGTDSYLGFAIRVLSCPDCSPDVDPLIAVLLKMTHGHLAITCTAPPGWPPSHLHWCATATDQIAELTSGILLDAETPCLLPLPWRTEPFLSREDFAVGDWIRVGCGRGDDGWYSMHTTGLSRLGLPELRTRRLLPHHVHGWMHLFSGLAQVLVSRLFGAVETRPDRRSHHVPQELVVTTTDVAVAGGFAKPGTRRHATVRLSYDKRTRCLLVLAPAEFAGGEARWRDRAADAMCG